jgi:hypothetical protein
LGLGYTVKQTYDKHKAWWVKINARKAMTRDDFIRQQNILYLDCKHKNAVISLRTWAFNHSDDMFHFQY